MTWIRHALPPLAMSLLPRALLRRWLGRYLGIPGYRFTPAFSGRVALFELARRLGSPRALIPDYICDVVPRALAEAGCEVLTYPLGESFDTGLHQALDLAEQRGAGLIVAVSLYGSDPGLADFDRTGIRERLDRSGKNLVFDLCQDIELRHRLPTRGQSRIHAVVSFNDKSFPGAMGGGLYADVDWTPRRRRLSAREARALARRWLDEARYRCRPGRPPGKASTVPGLEFSTCAEFPYRIESIEPGGLQLAAAWFGLRRRSEYRRRQVAFLSDPGGLLATPFARTAPYLVVLDDRRSEGRRRKGPYATVEDARVTRRPGLRVVHNKGFWDEAPGTPG